MKTQCYVTYIGLKKDFMYSIYVMRWIWIKLKKWLDSGAVICDLHRRRDPCFTRKRGTQYSWAYRNEYLHVRNFSILNETLNSRLPNHFWVMKSLKFRALIVCLVNGFWFWFWFSIKSLNLRCFGKVCDLFSELVKNS